MGEESLQTLLHFFKTLAEESRLKILGFLARRECSVEELATLLGLKAPTVSHHLSRLKELNLVAMRAEGTTHLYRLNVDALHAMTKDVLTPEIMTSLTDGAEGEAWERKVLRDFFDGTRLKEIPASRKKRLVVLKWLVSQFEPAVRYPEAQVNEVIKRHHPDFATIRRELIMNRLMDREHGVYWLHADR